MYCGKTVGRIKINIGMQVGLGPGHIVLDGGPRSPSPKGGRAPTPIFDPYLLRPNGCMDQDATWNGDRTRPRRLCVRWGPRSALPKKGAEPFPKFSTHVYCGQTAGWIKTAGCVKMVVCRPQPRRLYVRWGPSPSPKNGAEPPPHISALGLRNIF